VANNQFPSRAYDGVDVKTLNVYFETTAAAQDKNILIMYVNQAIQIVGARIMFEALDDFANGVDIDLEKDDGTTETVLASYDTDGDTAADTIYRMVPAASQIVEAGVWLQLRVDDDEDAACIGHLALDYIVL